MNRIRGRRVWTAHDYVPHVNILGSVKSVFKPQEVPGESVKYVFYGAAYILLLRT